MEDNAPPEYVQCSTHGRSEPRMICHHLKAGSNKRFLENEDGDQAWCGRCSWFYGLIGWLPLIGDRLSIRHADPRMICKECYEKTRLAHERPGDNPPSTSQAM
jgi:hypothetical protein